MYEKGEELDRPNWNDEELLICRKSNIRFQHTRHIVRRGSDCMLVYLNFLLIYYLTISTPLTRSLTTHSRNV